MPMIVRSAAVLGLALALPVSLAPAAAAPGDTIVLSAGAGGPASEPVLSANGRFGAFTAEEDGGEAVRLGDAAAGSSAGISGAPPGTRSFAPGLSATGGHVAFATDADLGDGGDPDAVDVYLHDTSARTTVLISRADGHDGAGGDEDSGTPAVSADGRLVAFGSDADGLSADDEDSVGNVYVRDVVAGTTRLVSRGSGASGPGIDAPSLEPAISGDGRFVAFRSFTDDGSDILLRDRRHATTTLVSRAPGAGGAALGGENRAPALSADGRLVAFAGDAGVHVRDTVAATSSLVAPGGDDPALSGDGRLVAFVSDGRVVVRDLRSGVETVASAPGEPAAEPALSADGRFVAFSAGGRILRRELGTPAPGRGPARGGGRPAGDALDRTPPRLSMRLPTPQRLAARLGAAVRCSGEPCRVTVSATIATRAHQRRPRRLHARTARLRAGGRAVVRLAVPRGTRRGLRRALRRGAPVTATVTATARDAAGNVAIVRLAALLR